MDYIVLDLEWNQPFTKKKKCIGDITLDAEIISIGAVRMSEKLEDTFEAYIKPMFYKRLNPYVKRITELTADRLRTQDGFLPQIKRFFDWCGDEYRFITWGPDDMNVLRENMRAHGMNPSVIAQCYDLQRIFNMQITHESRQWSLANAMEKLEIVQQYRAHDALSDALNTAKIANLLNIEEGISRYTESLGNMTVSSVRIPGFDTYKSAICDSRVFIKKCPICSNLLSFSEQQKSFNKLTALASCPEHGTLKISAVVFKENGKYTVKRKIRTAPLEEDTQTADTDMKISVCQEMNSRFLF